MFKFIKLNETYRGQNYLELSQIANMDETPIFLNMTRTKTIAKIGSKTVNIKTHGQEKVRVTAILWNVADGAKLPPMLIFKGEPNGRIAKQLEKHPLVESKQAFAYWHKKHGIMQISWKSGLMLFGEDMLILSLKRRICSLWVTHLCIRYQK